MTEEKEWISVKHGPTSTTVTCSMMEDNLSVRWTVKTYVGQIGAGVREARVGARKAMAELRSAISDSDQEAA